MADQKSKRRSISRRTPMRAGVQHFSSRSMPTVSEPEGAPNLFGSGVEPEAKPSDPIRAFMKDHPKGSLPDTDGNEVVDAHGEALPPGFVGDGPLPPGETPESLAEKQRAAEADGAPEGGTEEGAAADASAAPSHDTTPQGKTEPTAPVKPSEPAAPAQATVETEPVAEKPLSYDYHQKVQLTDDPRDTWEVWQIAQELGELPELRPAKAERDRLLQAFNSKTTDEAVARITPYIEALKENPARAEAIDAIAAADPATVNYVKQMLEYFPTLTEEQRWAFGEVRRPEDRPAAKVADPRYDRLVQELRTQRSQRQVQQAVARFPYLATDRAQLNELAKMADALEETDLKNGVDPLDTRGLDTVLEMMRGNLEARLIVYNEERRRMTRPAEPKLEPKPGEGHAAVLPSSEPEPPGARPQHRPSTPYRGPATNAVSAFEQDFPTRN
jgi:hypothetical protein